MWYSTSAGIGSRVTVGVLMLLLMQTAEVKGRNDYISGVPALFIFGDSTADNGNNNRLPTIARANFPPYGRDFDSRHATGRFSNGRLATDFIAEFLRLPLVVPYLSPEATMNMYQGVNFASAGGGILNRTGDVLGMKLSLWQQIDLFLEMRQLLLQNLGEEAAMEFLRHSIYYIAVGGNDFIHNYITNDTEDALLTPDQFTELLTSTVKFQLQVEDSFTAQTLLDAGARKIMITGAGPVGCLPHFLFTSNSSTGECLEGVNEIVLLYNSRLAKAVFDFNRENHGSHVIYRDIFNIVKQMTNNPQTYGFTVGNTACCGTGAYGGRDLCLEPAMVCENPGDFVWWDLYHPSHTANHFIASQVWGGRDPPEEISDGLSPIYTISFMTLEELAVLDLDSNV